MTELLLRTSHGPDGTRWTGLNRTATRRWLRGEATLEATRGLLASTLEHVLRTFGASPGQPALSVRTSAGAPKDRLRLESPRLGIMSSTSDAVTTGRDTHRLCRIHEPNRLFSLKH